jgi:hypothetical protein
MNQKLADLVEQANKRLKANGIKLKIELRSAGSLNLRGVFPAKPGALRQQPQQQRLPLQIPASLGNIARAEEIATLVGAQLRLDQFKWEPWLPELQKPNDVNHWVCELEKQFWRDDRDRTSAKRRETWRVAYHSVLKSLPMAADLSIELLEKWIQAESTPTRRREHYVTAANRLCKLAGIRGADFSWLLEDVQVKAINPRKLPSDETLVEIFEQVRDTQYRWVVGMIIAYGLRNHELFGLDTTSFPEITVGKDTKTGHRIVIPLMPNDLTVQSWGLDDVVWPTSWPRNEAIVGRSNSNLGLLVTRLFHRKFDYTAYDCRHCFARRLKDHGLDSWDGAKLMGHSERTHRDRYQCWFGERYAIDRIKKKLGRS